jgi:hypothetical protein
VGSVGQGLVISGYAGSVGGLPIPYCGPAGTIYAVGTCGALWLWAGALPPGWVSIGVISSGTGGGGGGSPNLDGGQPDSNYGGISSICGGGVSV